MAPGGVDIMEDVRCPSCRRLVARRRSDDSLEIRHRGQPLAVVRHGEVYCVGCGVSVGVEPEPGPAKVETFRALSEKEPA